MSLSLQLLNGSPQFSVMDSPADNEGSVVLKPTDTYEKTLSINYNHTCIIMFVN